MKSRIKGNDEEHAQPSCINKLRFIYSLSCCKLKVYDFSYHSHKPTLYLCTWVLRLYVLASKMMPVIYVPCYAGTNSNAPKHVYI